MSDPIAPRAKTACFGLLVSLVLTATPWNSAVARPLRLEEPDYLVDVWEADDELPDDVILTLAQTPDGYLWAGAPGGLIRFDGFQFTLFTADANPGLPSGGVQHLLSDGEGRLWIGTDQGLGWLKDGAFSTLTGFVGPVTALAQQNGALWIAGTNGLICQTGGESGTNLVHSPRLAGLLGLVGGRSGPWTITTNGLHRFDQTAWAPVATGLEGTPLALQPAFNNGGVWLADANSLLQLRDGESQRQLLRKPSGGEPLRLLEDSRGHLWVANAARGLVRYSSAGADRTIEFPHVRSRHRVLSALEDREGGVWFGTDGAGLVRLKPRRFTLLGADEASTAPGLAGLLENSPGSRIVAAPKQRFSVQPAGQATLSDDTLRALSHATCALAWTNGTVLAGTPVGLRRIDVHGVAEPVLLPFEEPIAIHHLARATDGSVLVATSAGLASLQGDHVEPIALPPGVTGVSRVVVTPQAVYVALLPEGLARWTDHAFSLVTGADSRSLGRVTAMAAGADGRLWLSAVGCPLAHLQNDGVTGIPGALLPPVSTFSCLAEDSTGALWMGSDDGLFRLQPDALSAAPSETDGRAAWTRFDTKDGLASPRIQTVSLAATAGAKKPVLVVGTQRGLGLAQPAELKLKAQPCRPVIESLVCYERRDTENHNHQTEPNLGAIILKAVNEHATILPLGSAVEVPRGAHRIEARFTAVNFDAPERLHFRYRLLGLDADWTELEGNCPVPFHQLPPGRYTFQLKASNSDGVWGEEIATVGFVIQPTLWQGPWFRTLLGLGAVAGAAGYIWNANRARTRRHEELLEQQRSLAREKARLASVLETTSDVVAFADPDLRIFYLNPAGCRTLEVAAPSLDRSLPFDSILDGDSLTRFHEEAAPAAILRGVWSGEMALHTEAGRRLLVSQVMLCHKHTDGSVDFFSFVMRDLSPIREAEARHEKLEAQLRQAQKMEAVGLLAGGVAHDFNNILQVILGHSSIALEKDMPPAERENSLLEVRKAARRAAQLTKQLLAFGRRQPLQKLHFDLNQLVREALDMSRRLLGADIEMEFIPSGEPAVIYADRGQIEQVLMNLCVNARDAMPRGGKLTVQVAPIFNVTGDGDTNVIGPLPGGPCVRLTVADTGLGISPDNLPHIFEPFFTTKPKNKGSGLGLSVVYGIIQQHGGNLRLESTVNVGTKFHVYLPASPGTVAAQRVTRELPVLRGSGTILVAEDEEPVRLLATRILQRAGYTVLAARDGEEAVALFREHQGQVDLLLMDVIMPRLTGPEAVKKIHELSPDIPVLYASGYGGDFLRADGRLDFDGEVLQKPYQPSELLDRINGTLRHPR